METKFVKKGNSGISLVTIVITILVIIILAAISMNVFFTQDRATFAKFVQEFEEVRKGVETKRLVNAKYDVENADYGFSRVYVTGDIPYNFMSLDQTNGEKIAYLVNLSYIGYDELITGRDYPKFEAEGSTIKTVTFGKDDVFVYDSTGRLFYAKGFNNDGNRVYESTNEDKSIRILNVETTPNSNTSVKVTVTIESKEDVKSVTIGGIEANKTGDNTYELEVYKNGNYEIVAENVEGEKATGNVFVTGIGNQGTIEVTAEVTNASEVLSDGKYVLTEKTAKIRITSDGAKELYIGNSSSDVPGTYLPFTQEIEKYYTTAGEKEVYIYVKDEYGNVSSPYIIRILIKDDGTSKPEQPPKEDIDFGDIQTTITPPNDEWSRTKYLKIEYPEGKQSNGYTSMYRISIDKEGTRWGRWTISYDKTITLEIAKEAKVEIKIVYESNRQKAESDPVKSVDILNVDRIAPKVTKFESLDTGEKTVVQVEGRDDESGLNNTAYMLSLNNIDFSNLDKVNEYEKTTEDGLNMWTSQKEFEVIKDGKYYLYVRDSVNNVTVNSLNVDVVDRTPPVIKSLSATAILDYVVIRATVQDETGVVAYALTTEEIEPVEWTTINEQEIIAIENIVRDEREYFVWAKDAAGNTVHGKIKTVINKFPELDNSYPKDLYIKEGEEAKFEVVITKEGEPAEYEFEWQVSSDSGATWNSIENTNSKEYKFITKYEDNNKQYRCLIKHARGTLISKIGKIQVVRITTDKPSGVITKESDMILGGIIINNGAKTTKNTKLSLEIIALNAYEMNISETDTFSPDNWKTYSEKIDYELSDKSIGNKKIYVQIRDAKGNVSNVVSAEIQLEK